MRYSAADRKVWSVGRDGVDDGARPEEYSSKPPLFGVGDPKAGYRGDLVLSAAWEADGAQ